MKRRGVSWSSTSDRRRASFSCISDKSSKRWISSWLKERPLSQTTKINAVNLPERIWSFPKCWTRKVINRSICPHRK
jgi:hypothetical protein